MAGMGAISLGAGFLSSGIMLIVFRAFIGCSMWSIYARYHSAETVAHTVAALTIPSALKLLVVAFPDGTEQARAIALFGSFTAIGMGEPLEHPSVCMVS